MTEPLINRMRDAAIHCSGHGWAAEAHTLRDGIREIERLRASFDTQCPCCAGIAACAPDCTFESDAPQDHARMEHMRDWLETAP